MARTGGPQPEDLRQVLYKRAPLSVSSAVKIQEGVSFWSWWELY